METPIVSCGYIRAILEKFPRDPNCAQFGVLQGNLHPSSCGNAIKGLAPTLEIGRKALKST